MFANAVLGYRCWKVDDAGKLRPLYLDDQPWEPGVNQAECLAKITSVSHPAPDPDCDCGFNAYHKLKTARLHLLPDPRGNRPRAEIIGAVAGRGNIEVHHAGWRAGEAQIIGLLDMGKKSRSRMIADRYQVPLFPTGAELEKHARRLAAAVPEDLLPPGETLTKAQVQAAKAVAGRLNSLQEEVDELKLRHIWARILGFTQAGKNS